MARKKLRVLVVGCGGMSRAWLGVATTDPSLDVVGLVDVRREAALERARQYGLPEDIATDSLDEALARFAPDVVFDVTVPEAHCDVVTKSLRAGCHVCGEKPLADSMAHARRMVAAAEKADRTYAVMQNRRYLPYAPAVTRAIAGGLIGDVTTVNVDFYIGVHFGGFRDEMDHPLLLDMAIHTFDQARQLTGAGPVGVYAKEFNPKASWYAGDVSAQCIFDMSDDIVFNYRGSWCSEGFSTPWEGTWRIVGTKGTILWRGDDAVAQVVKPGSKGFARPMRDVTIAPARLKAEGHPGIISEFLRCIRAGKAPQTDCTDNIKSLAMVFGAIRSAKLGRYVKIDA